MALSSNKVISSQRYFSLDIIRGIAIVLMVVFHFSFDLNNFKFIDINIYNSSFWHYFRFVIVSMFLLCVGISLYLSNKNGINFSKIKKRFFILILASLAISLSTYVTFPNSWIYFGILHFIAFVSVVGLFFVFIPTLSLLLGLFIIIGWNLNILDMHWLFDVLHEFVNLPARTEDSVPLTPWFGVVLLGIYIGYKGFFNFKVVENRVTKKIAFLGRHSLVIYLIHQPILFSSVYLIHNYIT